MWNTYSAIKCAPSAESPMKAVKNNHSLLVSKIWYPVLLIFTKLKTKIFHQNQQVSENLRYEI